VHVTAREHLDAERVLRQELQRYTFSSIDFLVDHPHRLSPEGVNRLHRLFTS
jgi:hypothetical protein